MKLLLSALVLFFSLASFQTQAAVWQSYYNWDLQYEREFSLWMQSSMVREKMFTDPSSLYYGINPDCADTAYALRAIFAFEHRLPFAIKNPSGNRPTVSKTMNNKTNKFDKAGPEHKRLIAMITEIGDSVGTENLTRFDTYPPGISYISPGTIFTYKIPATNGQFIRHTFNIKTINPIGTFDVIFSTQATQNTHGDLMRRRNREFDVLPNDVWGFRRFRWPQHIGWAVRDLPWGLGASNEQYDLASKMDSRAFFKYIGQRLSTTTETPDERVQRLFESACLEAHARIDYVNEALYYLQQTNNACMDYAKFDAYSTPGRDASIKEMFEQYRLAYIEAKSVGAGYNRAGVYADYIFNVRGSANIDAELRAACPVAYRAGTVINLAVFWYRMANKQMSSHPNDMVQVRWGEQGFPATTCKRHY